MEQFVLVPASLYNNRSMNTRTATKQELPKCQAKQNLTYQTDSLKKEINEQLFAKADFSVDEMLTCLRMKLSILLTLIVDGVESGILLSDFAQQLRRRNAHLPDIYFILLDTAGISPTLVVNQKATAKKKRKLDPFPNIKVISCKDRTRSAVLLLGVCAI